MTGPALALSDDLRAYRDELRTREVPPDHPLHGFDLDRPVDLIALRMLQILAAGVELCRQRVPRDRVQDASQPFYDALEAQVRSDYGPSADALLDRAQQRLRVFFDDAWSVGWQQRVRDRYRADLLARVRVLLGVGDVATDA